MSRKKKKHNQRQTNTDLNSQSPSFSSDLQTAEETAKELSAEKDAAVGVFSVGAENIPAGEEMPGEAYSEPELYPDENAGYAGEVISAETSESISSGTAVSGERESFSAQEAIAAGRIEEPAEEEDIFASEALSDTVPIDIDEIGRSIEEEHYSRREENVSRRSLKKAASEDASFGAFVSGALSGVRSFIIENKRSCIIAVTALLFCIGIIALAGALSRKEAAVTTEPISVSADNVGELMSVSGAPLEEDAYPEVVELIGRYFAARKVGDHEELRAILSNVDDMKLAQVDAINEYISDFSDIKCYTKQGPYENSYIVYATYNCTFKDWEDYAAPALLGLLVCSREDGSLYIEAGEIDDDAAEFVRTVSAQQDVVDLFNRINTEYQEVIDSDPAFASYMEELKPKIARDVSVRVAELRENEGGEGDGTGQEGSTEETTGTEEGATEEAASGEEGTEDGSEETPEETPAENSGSFMVETTTAVNVRRSDSENADRIAQVAGGTQLNCIEQRANGWSHVIYNDEDGYIKSDYVRVVGGDNDTTTATNGRITVTSTVNVRGSASINGEVLGMAYAGESFELLERGAEWTKILFNGKTAYVKSDYVSN